MKADDLLNVRTVAAHCQCYVCRVARQDQAAPPWVQRFVGRVLRDAARHEREQRYQERLARMTHCGLTTLARTFYETRYLLRDALGERDMYPAQRCVQTGALQLVRFETSYSLRGNGDRVPHYVSYNLDRCVAKAKPGTHC